MVALFLSAVYALYVPSYHCAFMVIRTGSSIHLCFLSSPYLIMTFFLLRLHHYTFNTNLLYIIENNFWVACRGFSDRCFNPFMLNVRFNEHGIFDRFSMHKFWQKMLILRLAFRWKIFAIISVIFLDIFRVFSPPETVKKGKF